MIGFQHETEYDPKILGYSETAKLKYTGNCLNLIPEVNKSLKEMKGRSDNHQPTWLSIGTTDIHLGWEIKGPKENFYDPDDVDVPPFLPDTEIIRKHLGQLYYRLKRYDNFIGKVMKKVKDLGLDKNTIIVLTTDHGIAHPRAKGTLYDPGNHNMMIFSYPKEFIQGKKIHSLLSSIDFVPTMCEICGIPSHLNYMGKSYASLLTSETKIEKTQIQQYIYTEMTYHDKYNPMRSVRSERFKYIRNYEPDKVSLVDSIPGDIKRSPSYKEWVKYGTNTTRLAEEFFDLELDPLEENNLLGEDGKIKNTNDERNGEYQEKVDELKQALNTFLAETHDAILNGPYPSPKCVNASNADDFAHIPKQYFSSEGIFSREEEGIPMIETSYGSQGMKFFIPIGEIFEEFVGKTLYVMMHDQSEHKGELDVADENNVTIGDIELTSLIKDLHIVEGDLIKIFILKYAKKEYPTLIIEKMDSYWKEFH